MVRPFDLRDLTLIRRLGERGVPLNAVSALAENLHPMRGAIMNMLIGGDYPTFIWKEEGGERAGFVQLRVGSSSQAQVVYISPKVELLHEPDQLANFQSLNTAECDIWLELLDEAVAEVGQRGIHHIVAEVDENSPALLVLRRAGFAVYTRQDVWAVYSGSFRPQSNDHHRLIRRHMSDDWDIQLLYANTVPRLVQLVEPMPPLGEGENWVLRTESKLAAFVHLHRGAVATWIRFFIHPEAESEAEEIVNSALQVAFSTEPPLVYCCVRRYESWLPSALEASGFSILGSQAVMVRHTVHHPPRVMVETAMPMEGHGVSAPSTFVRNIESADSIPRTESLTGIHGT